MTLEWIRLPKKKKREAEGTGSIVDPFRDLGLHSTLLPSIVCTVTHA